MKNEIKIKREVEIDVDGGYVIESVNFECWVKNFEEGGEALMVIKDNSGDMNDMLCYCTIICVVDDKNPDEYEKLIIENGDNLFYDYSAEFMTEDNAYCVFMIENRTEALSKAFNLQVEDKIGFRGFNGYYEVC